MNEVSHKGKVVEIGELETKVEIFRNSACSECHAKNLCGVAEGETRIVSVETNGFDPHNVGDEVEVCMKRTMGMKAVWVSYVIPLFILLLALFAGILAGASELVSGLSAIASVAIYYVVVWCMRERLNNEFVFYIK